MKRELDHGYLTPDVSGWNGGVKATDLNFLISYPQFKSLSSRDVFQSVVLFKTIYYKTELKPYLTTKPDMRLSSLGGNVIKPSEQTGVQNIEAAFWYLAARITIIHLHTTQANS